MRRYSSSQVRQRFAEMLDAAEQGETVVIERHQARFVLRALPRPAKAARRPEPVIEYVDPAVVAGGWTWTWGRGGVGFKARKRRR